VTADATWVPITDDVSAIRLASDELLVDVLPANGADVQAIVDRRTGINLLWTAPWGTGLRPEDAPTSRDRWLTRIWGGWQLLLPNTGDEAQEGGRTWGFHGEAGLRRWDVADAGPDQVVLAVALESAPLDVRRTCRVSGPTLVVETTVRNRSADAIEFLWGEHPTYGEGFAAEARLELAADTFVTELADNVGVRPGDRVPWPGEELGDASLDRIPPSSPGRFLFGFVDGLHEGSYRITNERLDLAARVTWPLDVFPCVWLWEEVAYTADPPWGGRAYAVGVEPQAAWPALGMTGLRRFGGRGLTLDAGESISATVTVTVEPAHGRA
jgi:hypothetical protein